MSRKEPTTLPRNGSSGPCRRRHGDARVRSTPKARPPAACSPLPSRCALESPAPFPATLSVPRTVSAAPATAWPRPQLSATPLAPDAICNRFLPGPKFMKTVGPKDLTTLTCLTAARDCDRTLPRRAIRRIVPRHRPEPDRQGARRRRLANIPRLVMRKPGVTPEPRQQGLIEDFRSYSISLFCKEFTDSSTCRRRSPPGSRNSNQHPGRLQGTR